MDLTTRLDPTFPPPTDDVREQAQRVLIKIDQRTLLVRTIVTLVALALFCGGDILLNLLALGTRFANDFGQRTGSVIVYGTSFVTLGAFLLIGGLWGAQQRTAAIAAYALLVGVLAFLLLPVFDGLISESLAAQAPGSFGDSTATVARPLFWMLVGILGIAFTVPGLCVIGCELTLAACWDHWQMRWEAQRVIDAHDAARASIAKRTGLMELRKLDVPVTADGWTNEVLMDYCRRLETHCNELGGISGDVRYTREQRHRAYAQLTQTKNVIDSLGDDK